MDLFFSLLPPNHYPLSLDTYNFVSLRGVILADDYLPYENGANLGFWLSSRELYKCYLHVRVTLKSTFITIKIQRYHHYLLIRHNDDANQSCEAILGSFLCS
jgi:hypothetical protein